MTRVILDRSATTKLHDVAGRVEVCDESGQTLGYFTPKVDRSMYEGVEAPIGEADLRRIERDLGGRPLAEILADLETRS